MGERLNAVALFPNSSNYTPLLSFSTPLRLFPLYTVTAGKVSGLPARLLLPLAAIVVVVMFIVLLQSEVCAICAAG